VYPLLINGTTVTATQTPSQDDLAAANYYYLGGHEYTISDYEANSSYQRRLRRLRNSSMSNCTSSCKTKDHANYGECIRSNTPMFVGVNPTKTGWDQDKVKRDEKEIQSYWAATKQGIEPRSTRKKDIDAAVKLSNEAGKAFDGISLTYKE
jgi:hypothetical protein